MDRIEKVFPDYEVIECSEQISKEKLCEDKLINKLERELKLRGFSTKTIKSYRGHIRH